MMKVFTISQGKKVPDGMVVYPFLKSYLKLSGRAVRRIP